MLPLYWKSAFESRAFTQTGERVKKLTSVMHKTSSGIEVTIHSEGSEVITLPCAQTGEQARLLGNS